MATSLKEFTECLEASGLMTAREVEEWCAPSPDAPTAEILADRLVENGRLTPYQAGRLLEGQPRGLMLGNYVIRERIGSGGMGEVYRAEHRRMKREVVIKILPGERTQSAVALGRFQREVEAAARLRHENIVTAFDADEADGIHFLVMESVRGRDLGTLVSREGALPVGAALDYMIQVARGLAYAHGAGIIHRDIKPGNLLVSEEGVVKILDMGLVRFAQSPEAQQEGETGDALTQVNQIVGTLEYMSPEQADDSAHVDGRSDIYSLGCTLFRLLAGRPPYAGDTTVGKLLAHRIDPIPSICAIRPDAPKLLDEVFARMVAKRPADRYAAMEQVIADLERCRTLSEDSGERWDEVFGDAEPQRSTPFDDHLTTEMLLDAGLPTATAVASGPNAAEQPSWGSAASHRRARIRWTARPVGIDLGTTFSVIAYLDEEGRPRTVENAEGDKTTPSALLFDDDGVIVGKEAIKAMATDMERVAECVKRELGGKQYHRPMRGISYPPEAMQAWILNKLRLDAAKTIGAFEKVVITVPAYFDEVRRKATQDAGYMAGFEVIDIINEPTAAALAFGREHPDFAAEVSGGRPKRVVVYDLGGGTFDLTVMEIAGNEFKTLATDGDVRLGGRDWDQRLVDHVAQEFAGEFGIDPREEPNSLGRLLRDCEEAKRTLSARQRTMIVCQSRSCSKRVTVTREMFQSMTQDLLDRTAFTTRQTLRAAGLQWSDVDLVLLVGGATRMPAVREMLQSMSGRRPDSSVSPDEAVAHGAALRAGMLFDQAEGKPLRIRIQNVNSHSLGVAGVETATRRKQTGVLIPRNTPLPCVAQGVFHTSKKDQRSVLVQIVEGEAESPAECVQIGKCVVRDLPPGLPAQTPIEVRFRYEENGRLTVRVRVAGTSTMLQHEIRRENVLTPEELNRWRARISGLPPAEHYLSDASRQASRREDSPVGG